MNVEDIAMQISVVFETECNVTEKTQFPGCMFVSPDNAETLVRRGRI